MRTTDYNVALKLSQITGKPLEDFYEQDKNEIHNETSVETISTTEITANVRAPGSTETASVREKTYSEGSECGVDRTTELQRLASEYDGKIINGAILRGRQMTRKEYLAAKRKFKSSDDLWDSPLIYLMFRAEGQVIPSFIEWTTNMEKELDK